MLVIYGVGYSFLFFIYFWWDHKTLLFFFLVVRNHDWGFSTVLAKYDVVVGWVVVLEDGMP